MAEETKNFADHYRGFKRHLKLGAITALAICAIGSAIAFSLPDMYKSTALILIEEPDIPEDLIRTTVTTYATKQISSLNEKIMTVSNLASIIEKFGLYADARKDTPVELLTGDVRKNIGIDFVSAEAMTPQGIPRPFVVAFNVSFIDESPSVAQQVANELVSLYMEENLKARTQQTSKTTEFLDIEVGRLEKEIGALESKLARFKELNGESLPSLNSLNLQQMTRVDDQLRDIDRQLAGIEENRISIRAQMATIEPTAPLRLADGQMVMSPQDQLKALQTQLAVVVGRYSEDHPDVVRIRNDIKSLQDRFGLDADLAELDAQLVAARTNLALTTEKYSPEHPDVIQLKRQVADLEAQAAASRKRSSEGKIAPDNPAYVTLQAQLDTLNATDNSLQAEKSKLRQMLTDYEQRLVKTPQVESELNALARELNSTTNRYWVMRDKQFSAEMGENLETEAKGERFTLVEPPNLPLRPASPNRPAIIALALIFALIAGIGITQVADSFDRSINSPAVVAAIQGVPPIAEIPYIRNDVDIEHMRRSRMAMLASVPAMLIVAVLVLHFTIMPLDVLWYAALRRIGF